MARAGLVLIAVMWLPAAAAAQGLRQPERAFDRTVSLNFALGFHGARAERTDSVTDRPGCAPCNLSYGPGGGPHISLRVEEPVSRRTALRLGADWSDPSLKTTRDGGDFQVLQEHAMAIRGEAVLLFRLKPSAPVFFGLGGTYTYWDPGPVARPGSGQQEAGAEYGAIISLGYDATIQDRWGVRFEFLNYVMVPSDQGLPDESFTVKGLTRDWTLGVGVRYRLAQ